jgi:NitT/TauT family transport system permease protein
MRYLFRLALVFLGLIFTWHLLTINNVNWPLMFGNLPKPAEVFWVIFKLMFDLKFYQNVLISLLRVYLGVLLGFFFGLSLALLCYRYKILNKYAKPIIELFRPIPNVAWVPLTIILFPTLDQSIIFITFIGSFFPIFTSIVYGLKTIPDKYQIAVKSLKLNDLQKCRFIYLPAVIDNIFSGLKIGMGVSFLGVIVAEMVAGKSGIGYFTWMSYQLLDYESVVAGVFVISFLGVMSNLVLSFVEKRVYFWKGKI